MAKTFFIVLTSALAIDGNICRAGELVEVTEDQAKNFLHRGKAVLATPEDLKKAGIEQDGEEGEDDGEDLHKLTKEQLLAKTNKGNNPCVE